jgi:hypothetical protein
MAVHKHTSWGRTRSPKALGANVPTVTRPATAAVVTTVAASDLSDTLTGTNAGENGYVTENQRFLHIQIENNDDAETLAVYVYNYAFQKWAQLYLPHGSKVQADTNLEANTTNDRYVTASWNSINGKFLVTIPIHGIDRVAFVDDGTHDANFIVKAACSTF